MIDNALDAADNAGIAPVLSIELSGDFFTVADNGPGLPLAMLEGSLDYSARVSDIERLIADDAEAVVRFRELVVAGHGGDRKSENIKADNVSLDSDLFTKPAKKKADECRSCLCKV